MRGQSLFSPAPKDLPGAIFNLPNLSIKARATYRDQAGDNILALWVFDHDAASGTIALDDTPYFSTYTLHLTRPAIGSEADLNGLLSSVLYWDKRPLLLGPMTMAHSIINGSLRVSYMRLASEFEANNLILFFAATEADGWYATLKIGKGLISSFYPNSEFLPERFPSLEELMKDWPDSRVWSEIRNPSYSGYATAASEFRDRILTAELARRGLTTPQIIDLLRISTPYGFAKRAQVTAGTLSRVNRGWIDLYFKEALQMYESIGAKDAAIAVAGMARLHCSPANEASAMDMIDAVNVGSAAAHYLIACSNSIAGLDAVKAKSAAGELWRPDQSGIADMERRIRGRR